MMSRGSGLNESVNLVSTEGYPLYDVSKPDSDHDDWPYEMISI